MSHPDDPPIITSLREKFTRYTRELAADSRTRLHVFDRPRAPTHPAPVFEKELEGRLSQLHPKFNMVDGRVIDAIEAARLRSAVLAFVRTEVLPALRAPSPDDALYVLARVEFCGFDDLESERPAILAAKAAKFPPPPMATWPEIAELRLAAEMYPASCVLRPPAKSVYFATLAKEDRTPIPEPLLGLYAAFDGFDLASRLTRHWPVFSLLDGDSVGRSEAEVSRGFPARAIVFGGEDELGLSVYRDRQKKWWLVYDYEYNPIAKKPFDVRELLRFGLSRIHATEEELRTTRSWDAFFGCAR
jgi:hypothetical protein